MGGIRAVGYISNRDLNNDQPGYINRLKDDLLRLGAFGFENWWCRVYPFAPKEGGTDIRFVTFSDTDVTVTVRGEGFLVTDKAFEEMLRELAGSNHKPIQFKVDGMVAQLGDFKVRYGAISWKDRQSGVLLDIEYMPVQILSVDFSLLFKSVIRLMTNVNVKLFPQAAESRMEFDFVNLGGQYVQLMTEVSALSV
jgi:hypothetical protein